MADNAFEHPRLAAIYDALDPDRSDLDTYVAIAEELGARRVLDLGCGTGTFAILLARRGFEVTGVDPALASLDVARAKPGADSVRSDWEAMLRGVYEALRPGGYLVFETRNPVHRAWEGWNRAATYAVTEIDDVGAVENWLEVTDAGDSLVTFRSTTVFASDGQVLTSESTLRFRERDEVLTDLAQSGYDVLDVRDAPDRPGREFVFIAQRRD
jgi:hypothetical protein